MKQAIFVGCLLLVSSHGVGASPRTIFKRPVLAKVAHFLTDHVTLDVAAGASSGLATGGTFYCRSNNPSVEGCTAHYGSAAGTEIGRGVFTGAMIALSEYGRHKHIREWFVPVVGTMAFNAYWAQRQFGTHERPEPEHHRERK